MRAEQPRSAERSEGSGRSLSGRRYLCPVQKHTERCFTLTAQESLTHLGRKTGQRAPMRLSAGPLRRWCLGCFRDAVYLPLEKAMVWLTKLWRDVE